MEVLTVDCNYCGAPLEVSSDTRYVTCRYCKNRLAIKHSDTSVYTEVLEQIHDKTEKISQDMDILKLQNQLEQLDREWLLRREAHMVTTKNGHRRVPTKAGSIVALVMICGVGTFVLTMFGQVSSPLSPFGRGFPGFVMIIPLLALTAIVVGTIRSFTKARAHGEAEKRYHIHRRQLLSQLERKRKD